MGKMAVILLARPACQYPYAALSLITRHDSPVTQGDLLTAELFFEPAAVFDGFAGAIECERNIVIRFAQNPV